MTDAVSEFSPSFKGRTAGFFWLTTFITGAFAMLIGGRLVVNGNAAATTANILANESAFHLGAAGNLVATVCYLSATLFVYEILKPVNRTVSLLAAFFSLIGCGIGALVVLLNLAPLLFLNGPSYLSVFTTEQLQALALTSFRLGGRANEVGLVFFGLHIFLVGLLIVASGYVPRALGLLLAFGGVCYLTNSFASFVAEPFATALFPFTLLPAFVAELALSLWLLLKGVNAPRPMERSTQGGPIFAETTTGVLGSGLGAEDRMHSVATYSDYRPAGSSLG